MGSPDEQRWAAGRYHQDRADAHAHLMLSKDEALLNAKANAQGLTWRRVIRIKTDTAVGSLMCCPYRSSLGVQVVLCFDRVEVAQATEDHEVCRPFDGSTNKSDWFIGKSVYGERRVPYCANAWDLLTRLRERACRLAEEIDALLADESEKQNDL